MIKYFVKVDDDIIKNNFDIYKDLNFLDEDDKMYEIPINSLDFYMSEGGAMFNTSKGLEKLPSKVISIMIEVTELSKGKIAI